MIQVCQFCGKEFKRLSVHMKSAHPLQYGKGKLAAGEENSSSAPLPIVKQSSKVKFVSSRASGLTVVIRPKRRGFVNTSGGAIETIVDEGKRVAFNQGILETDDPEVINYLTNVYKDLRFPITRMPI